MSVRDYAVMYLKGGRPQRSTAGGGNTLLATGPHSLDGPEHTAAGAGTRLDASTSGHGLLPALSGVATEILAGAGTFRDNDAARVSFDDSTASIGATDVQGAIELLDASIDTLSAGLALAWFIVTDPTYGATGDGSTNETAAVDAAIAALISAGGGVLYFPAGSYKITAALTTITVPCLILGDGGGRTAPASKVFQTSASADLFTFSSEGVEVRAVYLENTSGGATTSRAIVSSAGGWMFIRDVGAILFKDGIDLEGATYYHISGCYISNLRYGIRIRNTAAPDGGDGSVIDNIILPNASGSGFRLESAGGLRFIGNKINANDAASSIGIDIAIGSITTASLIIADNSIENCKSYAISFTASGTGSWTSWLITGNQFGLYNNTATPAIRVDSNTANNLADGVIADNVFYAIANPNAAISLTKTKNVRVSGNVATAGWGSLLATSGTTGTVDDSGAIAAGVLITGTPSSGQVPIASSGTAAAWGTPTGATFATPAVVLGTAAAAGAAATVIRSDATIAAFDATVPVTQAFGDAAATGSAAFAAHRDHRHGMPATPSTASQHILLADGHATPFAFTDLLQMDDGSDFMWSDP